MDICIEEVMQLKRGPRMTFQVLMGRGFWWGTWGFGATNGEDMCDFKKKHDDRISLDIFGGTQAILQGTLCDHVIFSEKIM